MMTRPRRARASITDWEKRGRGRDAATISVGGVIESTPEAQNGFTNTTTTMTIISTVGTSFM